MSAPQDAARHLGQDLVAPEGPIASSEGEPDEDVAEDHRVQDVRVEKSGLAHRSLVVDVEFLGVFDEPGESLASLLVPTMLECDQVAQVDAAVRADLVRRQLS